MVVIFGYDYAWRVVSFDTLDTVQGMAWGVREDIAHGKRGLITNWCTAPSRVTCWDVFDL